MDRIIFLSLCSLVLIFTSVHGTQTVYNERTRIINNNILSKENGKEVFIRTTSQMDERQIQFEVDGKNFTFNLTLSKRKVFSTDIPMWLIKSNPNNSPNYTYELLNDDEKIVDGDIYIDNEKEAVILAQYDANQRKMLYNGVFGEGYQRHIIRSLTGRKMSRRSKKLGGDHIIYSALKSNTSYKLPDLGTPENMLENEFNGYGEILEKLSTPLKTMYPKVLVVIDHNLFQKFGKNIKEILKYMSIFWNAVDQKYEVIKSARVNIVVTGIIIADDEKVLNYMYQNRKFDKQPDGTLLDAEKMLYEAREYFLYDFYDDTQFDNYDAAIVMTPFDLEIANGRGGFLAIGGLASSIGKICDRGFNVAVAFDRKDYSGTVVVVHELGHLLNLRHDGAMTICSDYRNASSTSKYPVEFSVMAGYNPEVKYFWSNCSVEALTRLSTYKAAECLRTRSRN